MGIKTIVKVCAISLSCGIFGILLYLLLMFIFKPVGMEIIGVGLLSMLTSIVVSAILSGILAYKFIDESRIISIIIAVLITIFITILPVILGSTLFG